MIDPTASVIYSELVLSLYPILVKTVKTNLFTQTFARFLVYTTLSLAFGPFKDFSSIWTSPYEAFVGVMHGILNLAHVAVSFLSFKLLPAGAAVSLFYLYPIFNVIVSSIFFGDKLPYYTMPLFLIAIIGTYLIANAQLNRKTPESNSNETAEDKKDKTKKGIIMALMAAITETIIYTFVRSNKLASASPFYTMNHIYPAGLVALVLYALTSTKEILSTNTIGWAKLIGFNALLGFTGYLARFYSIPKLHVIVFSLLSFIGVISAYIWGAIFTNELPTKQGLIGGLLIASSIGLLRYFNI